MRRRLRRRVFWAAVLFGLVVLYVTVSVLRACLWARDVLGNSRPARVRGWA